MEMEIIPLSVPLYKGVHLMGEANAHAREGSWNLLSHAVKARAPVGPDQGTRSCPLAARMAAAATDVQSGRVTERFPARTAANPDDLGRISPAIQPTGDLIDESPRRPHCKSRLSSHDSS